VLNESLGKGSRKSGIEGLCPSSTYFAVFLRPLATIAATAIMTITTIAAAATSSVELGGAPAADVVVVVAVVGESVANSGPLAPSVGLK